MLCENIMFFIVKNKKNKKQFLVVCHIFCMFCLENRKKSKTVLKNSS